MKQIEIKDLSRVFGFEDSEVTALSDINLAIDQGEFIIIMGPSGCGKTTLMNILALLDEPSSGSCTYLTSDDTTKSLTRLELIGLAPQDSLLADDLTVIDNVALPLVLKGMKRTEARERAALALTRVNILHKSYFFPDQISSGQAQLASMARMLIQKPRIILADEPTGNLDSQSTKKVIDILKQLNNEGSTIIMVTHNPELSSFATRLIYMEDGRIAKDSSKYSRYVSSIQSPKLAPKEKPINLDSEKKLSKKFRNKNKNKKKRKHKS